MDNYEVGGSLFANMGKQAAAQLFEEKAKKPITQQQI